MPKVGTLATLFLFAAIFLSLGACSRPVEERTSREKKINADHKAKLNMAKVERNDPYWQAAHEAIERAAALYEPEPETPRRLPMARLVRGPRSDKTLLLTFDDGPHPASTLRLLKILKDEDVKATFFVIGKMVEKRPDLLRAIEQGGHTIANHSFSHVTLPKLSAEEIRTEYRADNDIVEKVTGRRMRFCRPPGGDVDPKTIAAARAEGLTTVLWTDDPGDFANPGDGIVLDRTLKRLQNGGVILLHDGSPNTLDTLRELIHEARARGFEFTTPADMVAGLQGRRHDPVAVREGTGRVANKEGKKDVPLGPPSPPTAR